MCVICLSFQRDRDFADARRMIAAARREPNDIDPEHLSNIEDTIAAAELAKESQSKS
jgi:hypothetical protein